jgi:DNA modification methylase
MSRLELNKIYQGDALNTLVGFPDESVDCIITSPPYWGLRDYGVEGQLGLEKTPEEYVAKMVEVFREAKRVLKKEGTLWLNLGDSYWANRAENGQSYSDNEVQRKRSGGRGHSIIKPKDLVGIPWRVAFALQADGWYLRQDIIWHKPNPMPESVTDRCTKSHEYIFLMSKSLKYYFDNEAIKEPNQTTINRPNYKNIIGNKNANKYGAGTKSLRQREGDTGYLNPNGRNKRSVWTVTTKPFKEAHFATFPEDLITPMVLAGCPKGGLVLDPFMGAGTTAVVARKLGRKYLGIELNVEYIKIAERRLSQQVII